MENATDALIMAGSVLLLIIALTVSISSFTNLRTQVDEIVTYKDEIEITTDSKGEYLSYLKSSEDTNRAVGIETIISTIRRLRKEQYTAYICLTNPINNSKISNVRLNDSEKAKIAKKFGKANFGTVIKFTLSGEGWKYVEDDDIIGQLYAYVKQNNNATFKEYIGVYQNATAEGVSTVNKETFKVLTFVQQP